MSGLEIVAAIAGIVGAFNGSVTIYRSWREKKRERLEKEEN
jgi:ABC-type antimicrobial peptide transport system permease subunit